MKLSFVYPIYNEVENLPRLLPETRRIAEGIASDWEVVLVDDGSTDGSGQFISRLAAREPRVRAVRHRRNRGLGAAIRTGLYSATKDLVLYMDSDFPVGVEEARTALRQFPPEVDLLIGYRIGRAEGPRREIMSWTYNRLIRRAFALNVRDVNFAFKLLRRSLLPQMRLSSEGSFIDAELLLEAHRLRARIAEVGMQYHSRVAGVSKAASLRVVLGILGELRRYRRRLRAGRTGPARVIVNADDFGLCPAINQGVVKAYDEGIVTSASLLPTGEAWEEAAALARARPGLDLGIHLALTQTAPVSSPEAVPSLAGDSGRFPRTWPVFVSRYLRGAVSRREIAAELRAQIERGLATGLPFSHLDSHQHIHMLPSVLRAVLGLAAEYNIRGIRWPRQRRGRPRAGTWLGRLGRAAQGQVLAAACALGRRGVSANGLLSTDDFRGFAEAGRWTTDSLAAALAGLDGGLTEIGCHPGADDQLDETLGWGYRWKEELRALTSREVAEAAQFNNVMLTTYREQLAMDR